MVNLFEQLENFFGDWKYTLSFLSFIMSSVAVVVAVIIACIQYKSSSAKDRQCIIATVEEMSDVCNKIQRSMKICDRIKENYIDIMISEETQISYSVFSNVKQFWVDFKGNVVSYPIASYEKYRTKIVENRNKKIKLCQKDKKIKMMELEKILASLNSNIRSIYYCQNEIINCIPKTTVTYCENYDLREQDDVVSYIVNFKEVREVFNSVYSFVDEYILIANKISRDVKRLYTFDS